MNFLDRTYNANLRAGLYIVSNPKESGNFLKKPNNGASKREVMRFTKSKKIEN